MLPLKVISAEHDTIIHVCFGQVCRAVQCGRTVKLDMHQTRVHTRLAPKTDMQPIEAASHKSRQENEAMSTIKMYKSGYVAIDALQAMLTQQLLQQYE